LEHGNRQTHAGQHHEPERQRGRSITNERKQRDGDCDPECLDDQPDDGGHADQWRVERGIDEKARRVEQRRLEAEVHQGAAEHLQQQQNADDSAGPARSTHRDSLKKRVSRRRHSYGGQRPAVSYYSSSPGLGLAWVAAPPQKDDRPWTMDYGRATPGSTTPNPDQAPRGPQ